jgi:hypothetical protein
MSAETDADFVGVGVLGLDCCCLCTFKREATTSAVISTA